MAGHSHWKQIKEKKGALDKKRGEVFSKLLRAVAVAARDETNPDFNPRLRTAIERAKQFNVPQENIDKAVKRVEEQMKNLEEVTMEAYGPGGVAFIIEVITNNKTRTIQEIRSILKEYGAHLSRPGGVRWIFKTDKDSPGWRPKFKQKATKEERELLEKMINNLEKHNDIQKVYTNLL